MKILGLSLSPRCEGNSDLLLRAALHSAQTQGAETEHLWIGDAHIHSCTACRFCDTTGSCKFQDDHQIWVNRLMQADRLIVATPVFFASVPAQAKVFIDRCQPQWVQRFRLDPSMVLRTTEKRGAAVLTVAGSHSQEHAECIHQLMMVFLAALGFSYWADLFVSGVAGRGAIEEHPDALREVRRIGRLLIDEAPTTPYTKKL
ncbi:flavodoxin family protein [Planctomycetota bacterium]